MPLIFLLLKLSFVGLLAFGLVTDAEPTDTLFYIVYGYAALSAAGCVLCYWSILDDAKIASGKIEKSFDPVAIAQAYSRIMGYALVGDVQLIGVSLVITAALVATGFFVAAGVQGAIILAVLFLRVMAREILAQLKGTRR